MKNKFLLAIAFISMMSFNAAASLITLERFDISGDPGSDLAAFWNAYTGTTELVSITGDYTMLFNGSANNNTLYKLTIDFSSDSSKDITFFAGLDAGFGAEGYMNGTANVLAHTGGLWWSRSWGNGAVKTISGIGSIPGTNILEFYWAENSNSGGNSFEIYEARIGRVALSEQSVAAAVPAPSTLALFSLVLLGTLTLRRNRKLSK